MFNVFRRIADLVDARRTFVTASVVNTEGSTPQKPGARMILFPDGSFEGTIGGGAMEEHVKREAAALMTSGGSKLVTVNLRKGEEFSVGGICGGDVHLVLERIAPAGRLMIFGGGHVGRAVAKLGAELGMSLVVYDDRVDYLKPDDFPQGSQLIHAPFEQAAERTTPGGEDAVAIVTYAYPNDLTVLRQMVAGDVGYIGMIGSKVKCQKVLAALREEGVSAADLNRVHAPIGLEIGAHTPAEVAISILGQIVQWMNQPGKKVTK